MQKTCDKEKYPSINNDNQNAFEVVTGTNSGIILLLSHVLILESEESGLCKTNRKVNRSACDKLSAVAAFGNIRTALGIIADCAVKRVAKGFRSFYAEAKANRRYSERNVAPIIEAVASISGLPPRYPIRLKKVQTAAAPPSKVAVSSSCSITKF